MLARFFFRTLALVLHMRDPLQTKDLSEEALLSKHAVDIVRDLQRLEGIEGDYDEGSASGPGRRKTIRNLEKSRRKTQAINTLDVAFRQRFFSMSEGAGEYKDTQ